MRSLNVFGSTILKEVEFGAIEEMCSLSFIVPSPFLSSDRISSGTVMAGARLSGRVMDKDVPRSDLSALRNHSPNCHFGELQNDDRNHLNSDCHTAKLRFDKPGPQFCPGAISAQRSRVRHRVDTVEIEFYVATELAI